jgi:hypothetical protein
MRTPSTDLFQLIQSMTAEEKRFFKSYIRQFQSDKQANNLQLFALIDQQTAYDEAEVKHALGGRLNDNQFAVAKNYLYSSLLKALGAYLGDRGGIKKVRQQLRMLEVLFQKELISQCEKLLERILELAERYDHPSLMLEILDWQRRIWSKRYFQGLTPDQLATYETQSLQYTEQMQRHLSLQLLHTQFMYRLRTKGFLRSSADMEQEFAEILRHPLLKDAAQADTVAARIPFHHTWGIYHLILGNAQEAYHHLRLLVLKLDQSPDLAYDYFELYVSVQYNYGIACLMLDHYDEVAEAVTHLDRLKTSFTSQRARIFYCAFLLRIELLAGIQHFKEGLQEAMDAAKKLPLYARQLTAAEHISIAFTIAYVFFCHGQYRACHRLILQEMGPDRVGGNPDLQVTVEVLRLVLYFEMKEDELFVQTYRSLYRFLRKYKPRYRFESHLLQAIRRYPDQQDAAATRAFFSQLLQDMQEIGNDPNQGRTIQTFKFDHWLKAKIEGISMLEVIRRQLQSQQN